MPQLTYNAGVYDDRFSFVDQSQPGTRLVTSSRASASSSRTDSTFDQRILSTSTVDEHLSQFWSLYLPVSHERDLVPAAPWAHAHASQGIALRDPLLRTALNACALMCLGRAQTDGKLVLQGWQSYAEALRGTNEALKDDSKSLTDSTLACCRALSLFEFFRNSDGGKVGSQGGDWSKHIGGLCRIYGLRGPDNDESDDGRELYEGIRHSAIIVDITYRRPEFCAGPSWQARSRKESQKSLKESLVDSVAGIPNVLFDTDVLLREAQQTSRPDAAILYGRCVALLGRYHGISALLRQWEANALASCDQTSFAHPKGTLSLRDASRLHGYGFFHLCHFYWATSVTLYANATILNRHITAKLNELEANHLTLEALPSWMEPKPLASHIVGTASHFFEPEAGIWGPQSAAFSLGAALHYFALSDQQHEQDVSGNLTDFGEIVRLLGRNPFSRMTSDFLRSISVDAFASIDRNDPVDGQSLVIARQWCDFDVEH